MKKNFVKNNIVTILLIVAVAFFIVGQFLPVSYYINSEFASQTFNDRDDNYEWKEISYNLFHYFYVRDSSYVNIGEKPLVQEQIYILNFLPITLSYDEIPTAYTVGSYEASSNFRFKILIAEFVRVIGLVFGLFAVYYFIKFLKELNKKPTKVPLFLGILILLVIIMNHISNLLLVASADAGGLGRTNYVKLGYGFYYQLVGVIILFLIYFIQNKPKFLKNIFLKDIFLFF